jgi:CRISPR-associated protein Cas2
MSYTELDNYFEFDQNELEERRQYLIVVIYDISNNKRRNKFSKHLQRYGFRLQRSSFECCLTKNLYEKLLDEIPGFIHTSDLLRVYKLTGNADVRIWGSIGKVEVDDVIVI